MINGKIIAINGKARSGKSTAADLFASEDSITIAFADKMKQQAMDIYGFSHEQLWGESDLRNIPDKRYLDKGITLIPRDVLIEMGTAGRNIYINTWVDYVESVINKIFSDPKNLTYDKTKGVVEQGYYYGVPDNRKEIKRFIISDLRFENEFNMIKENLGITIKIKRPDAGLKGLVARHAQHESEAGLPDDWFDFIINNDGNLNDLVQNVNNIKKVLE